MPSDANARTFQRFDELVEFLRRWRSWSDAGPHEYDVGSMLRLLGACVDNLKKFALDAELEDIAETLEPEQLPMSEWVDRFARWRAHDRSDADPR